MDGRATAGHQSALAKQNRQLREDDPAARELGETIVGALGTNPLFVAAALPAKVFPPLFNRYEGGEAFGTHIDNAIRQVTGNARARAHGPLGDALLLRARRSTKAASSSSRSTPASHSVKLPAGHMILYPADEPASRPTR